MPVTNEQLLIRVRAIRSKLCHYKWNDYNKYQLISAVFEIDVQEHGDREVVQMYVKALEELDLKSVLNFTYQSIDPVFDLMERYCRVWVVS